MNLDKLLKHMVSTMKLLKNMVTQTLGNILLTSLVIYYLFLIILDYLPIAALIENEILCIHGGLSPDIRTID